MTDPKQDVRQQFEAWADDQGYPMQRTLRGEDYQDLRTEGTWWAWQAALQSPAVRELVEADMEFDAACKGWPDERYESDSYGVYGSDFYRCLCCDAESGAGVLNKGVTHEHDCKVLAIEQAEKRRDTALRTLGAGHVE